MPCKLRNLFLIDSLIAMNKAIFLFSLILLTVVSAVAQSRAHNSTPTPSAFLEADRLFTFGENTERDKQSLSLIERSLAADGNNYQWLWRAARVSYFVGEDAPKGEKLRYFERGIETGQRAVAREPNAAEGHFWLAVSYGGYSEQKGVFKALLTVKKIRSEMEIVLKLNDSYQDGGAYLALGEMDRQLPRIIGGSVTRSISRLETGIKVAPHNLEIKYSLAQAYQEAGRKEDARREYQGIIDKESPSNAQRRLQDKARLKLAKL